MCVCFPDLPHLDCLHGEPGWAAAARVSTHLEKLLFLQVLQLVGERVNLVRRDS